MRPAPIYPVGGSGGGGGHSYAAVALSALSDPNSYTKGSTGYNSSTGLVTFEIDATAFGSDAITGPATSEAMPLFSIRLDELEGFDTATHILKVQFSSVSLPNEEGRLGIGAFVSPNASGGAADTGGTGILAFGASNDDRGFEAHNTSGVAGTPPVPAGKITDAECFFVFLDSGQVACNIWYSTASAPEEKFRGSRRDIVMSTSRLDADEVYLQIGLVKYESTAAPDSTTVSSIVRVGSILRGS